MRRWLRRIERHIPWWLWWVTRLPIRLICRIKGHVLAPQHRYCPEDFCKYCETTLSGFCIRTNHGNAADQT